VQGVHGATGADVPEAVRPLADVPAVRGDGEAVPHLPPPHRGGHPLVSHVVTRNNINIVASCPIILASLAFSAVDGSQTKYKTVPNGM